MTHRPLAGIRVVVTRAAAQAGGLARRLSDHGAEVALLPLLETVPPADPGLLRRAIADLDHYRWLVFTSANAVRAFTAVAPASEALPEGLRVAVVGPATATAARQAGLEPHLEASEPRAEGLLTELAPRARGQAVLIPQAADAGPHLLRGLIAEGALADAVTAYDKRLPAEAAERARELFGQGHLGWVTFTSPRIVRHFVQVAGDLAPRDWSGLSALSIGPVTSGELRRWRIEPAAQARHPEDSGLVEAVAGAVLAAAPETGGE